MTKKTPIKWELRFSKLALKNLKSLESQISELILDYLYQKIETTDDPRRLGKSLSGNLKKFWRYRIQDYRVICEIKDREVQVVVVRVAHRSKVYKNVHFLKSSV